MGVFVQTQTYIYNLIIINFCIVLLCSLHGPGPVLCMIRERHVILKAALHSAWAM